MATNKLHIAIVSSPGIGHLSPVLLLADRLVNNHNLHVTVIAVTTSTSAAQSQLISSITTNNHLSVIQIPAADISSIVAPDAKIVTQLCVMMKETVPSIRSVISAMDQHRPHVLIGDIFAYESWVVAEEFGMQKFVFVTSNAWFTGLFVYSPVLDKKVVGQYVDQTQGFEIPGCRHVSPDDVVDPMMDRADDSYRAYLDQAVRVTLTDGMLINTWEDLEPQSLDALRNNDILRSVVNNKPVYTVGPISRRSEPVDVKSGVIEWLEKQPENSVLYVSFGSGGTISHEQTKELAWGLEMSQQRFVWVVKPPTGKGSDGSYFSQMGGTPVPPDYFPDGFMTRTQKLGFLVSSWAPQVEILNHKSVGGFLTHCGWNSTLESITSGVPMIVLPLYAEQRMNATMLTDELEVAVGPAVLPTKKVVGREEIEKMIRVLMESRKGKTIRDNAKMLQESSDKAIKGSSGILIRKFIEDCWSRI